MSRRIRCNSYEHSIVRLPVLFIAHSLCLLLSLFRIPSLLVPPRPPFSNLPIPSQCTSLSHCFAASPYFTVCCLICCAFFTNTHTHVCMCTYTPAPFCMTEVPIPPPSITTSTYPCQQAVRAVTAGKGGQLVNDYFTLHLALSVCLSIKHTQANLCICPLSFLPLLSNFT